VDTKASIETSLAMRGKIRNHINQDQGISGFFPQGLKPGIFIEHNGTAEAVPLQNLAVR